MPRVIATFAATALAAAAARASPPPPGWENHPPEPMTYRDPLTSNTLYVESDGRHLAAIAADGKLLWVRDPFKGAHPCPAERAVPVVLSLKPVALPERTLQGYGFEAGDPVIEITYASLFFGYLNERTGDFVCIGIN